MIEERKGLGSALVSEDTADELATDVPQTKCPVLYPRETRRFYLAAPRLQRPELCCTGLGEIPAG